MKRIGFTMQLNPGQAEEYQRRHDEIWPELKTLLSENGIGEYTIWLDPVTGILFAQQTVADDYDDTKLAEHPVMKKWWAYMDDLMDTHADSSPVCKLLQEMFHM